jgi:uracil-DNA glycosylase
MQSAVINSGVNLSDWMPTAWPVAPDWQPILARFWQTETARVLGQFIQSRLHAGAVIYPSQPLRALLLTPLARVKVVILGQDPYHGPGQAEGLAFSVAHGNKLPPSLRNIYKELARDPAVQRKFSADASGSLIRWAEQGVLLLNTCLTVEEGSPASHAKRGWEALTDEIIRTIGSQQSPIAFLLWGAHAQTKQALLMGGNQGAGEVVAKKRHLVLTANHPSPLSALRPPAPFIGCGHFGQVNAFLVQHGNSPIDW